MNETIYPDRPSDVAWPNSDPRARMPDTSMLPNSEKAAPAAVGLLNSAAQGAHHTIDRLADSAAPAGRQLGETVSAAAETLHATTDQLRQTGNAWAESVRTTVRSKPLVSVAAALALGALIARIAR